MSSQLLSQKRFSLSGENLLCASQAPSPAEGTVLKPEAQEALVEHSFASGHLLRIDGEDILIENSDGHVSMRIYLNDNQPVVELSGANLQLQSPQAVKLNCNSFSVNSVEDISLQSAGHLELDSRKEMRLTCEEDIRIQGKIIWLN